MAQLSSKQLQGEDDMSTTIHDTQLHTKVLQLQGTMGSPHCQATYSH